MPPKHNLTGYIRSWAIVECFYPIFEFQKMIPDELHVEMEALFEQVRSIFAPNSRRTFGGLKGFFHKYQSRQRFLSETQGGTTPFDRYTAQHLADFLEACYPEVGHQQPADLLDSLPVILENDAQQQALRAFVNGQVAVTEALFNFQIRFRAHALSFTIQRINSPANVSMSTIYST